MIESISHHMKFVDPTEHHTSTVERVVEMVLRREGDINKILLIINYNNIIIKNSQDTMQ